jgi:NADH-quinone oxidoreductase subunit E
MSTGKIHYQHQIQPEYFAFTAENLEQAGVIIARYPAGRQQSAVMPLLTLAQQQSGGWVPKVAMDVIAHMLGMAPVRVYEVASFYTMYNLQPVGQHLIEVCTTTPCWLRGSDAILKACEDYLGIKVGESTIDGKFTLKEAECLGACVNAPMCQIRHQTGDDFYEDLTPENVVAVLDALNRYETPKTGPQSGRVSSEPWGGGEIHGGHVSGGYGAAAGTSGHTQRDTAQAEAPGIHAEGDKRYSGEPASRGHGGDDRG